MSKELDALERLYKCNDDDYTMGYQHHDYKLLQEALQRLEILKPICEIVETPVKKFRFLKVRGVVVYEFKSAEEYELFKEWLEDE